MVRRISVSAPQPSPAETSSTWAHQIEDYRDYSAQWTAASPPGGSSNDETRTVSNGLVGAIRSTGSFRVSRFAQVGLTCAALQLVINASLVLAGAAELAAFMISFALSAQLNFVLSDRWTWGSRRRHAMLAPWARWLGFNASSLTALAVGSTAFSALNQVLPNTVAAAGGIASGAVLTFVIGDRLVFTSRSAMAAGPQTLVDEQELAEAAADTNRDYDEASESILPLGSEQQRMLGRGVALFLPSFNEAENLPIVVARAVAAMQTLAVSFRVVIVNDGSRDDTASVGEQLVEEYEPYVQLVAHSDNLGYGSALRTGIAASLADGWDWVAYMDADGQFDPFQIRDLVDAAHRERADLVCGLRVKRADNLLRRVNGRLWHLLSRLVLGIRERDVDCGFKLVGRHVLEKIQLEGYYAAVSPELLIKSRRAGFGSAEVPVRHFPRAAGRQTGASFRVIVKSLVSLFKVRSSLSRSASSPSSTFRLRRSLRGAPGMAVLASVASISAFLYVFGRGETLLYEDAISHLLIARRVVDASTPGLGQLGSVWLPLTHLLAAPFVWLDALFYSGIAGSALSMIAFVITAVYLFRTGREITQSAIGGWIAGLVFVLNPNMLYLQTTPMTEAVLFAGMAAGVFHLTMWSRTDRWQHLAAASFAIFLASLTRYEGWVLLLCFAGYVAYVSLLRRFGLAKSVAGLTFFGVLACAGVAGWLLWNRLIFGSFTEFVTGEYATPSLWVSDADLAVGNLWIATKTYLLAMAHTVGVPMLLVGLLGLLAYLVRNRLRAESSAPLMLLVFLPFFVYALYTGQRPLHVAEISGDLYNTRFALVMLLPTTLFVGYLVVGVGRWVTAHAGRFGGSQGWRRRPLALGTLTAIGVAVGTAALTTSGTAFAGGVVTLQEPRVWVADRSDVLIAADALAAQYDSGRVLMQGFGNELTTFRSQVPISEIIYEGSFLLWQPALADPVASDIKWIVMSKAGNDQVWQRLHASVPNSYKLTYDDGVRQIYHHTQ